MNAPPSHPCTPPLRPPIRVRVFRWYVRLERWLVGYFTRHPPTLKHTLWPLLLLSVVLYIRHPATNYIFDEQEALLANPYVNAMKDLGYWDAIYRDFWGLPPDASIGSYRPLPNFIWRATWVVSKHPFFHHLYNLLFHALNGALLAGVAFAVTKRHAVGWLTGVIFVCAAVITEAVSGIVGLADVLGGLGAVLALAGLRLSAPWMAAAVFGGVLVGLFSKESALVCVPLVPVAALLTAPYLHPARPARWARTLISFVAAAGAFVLYVELRREWFPSPLPSELSLPLPDDASTLQVLHREFLVWFRQAPLPKDPLNNPLAEADFPHRVSGALRVYWRGFTQVLWPMRLSGDYSFPQEPIPTSLYAWESVAGGVLLVGPLLVGLVLLVYAWSRELRDKRHLVEPGALSDALAELMTGPPSAHPSRPLTAALLMTPRRPWHTNKLALGLLATVAALVALGTEYELVRRGGPTWVKTWPFALGLGIVGLGLLVEGWRGQRRPMAAAGAWPWRHVMPTLVALGLLWMAVSYFPHSNIPAVLPTVRAERFWYFPVIGTSLVLAAFFAWLAEKLRGVELFRMPVSVLFPGVFIGVQAFFAYSHSMDYQDDLAFWRATKNNVPRSAKAHLNYSVMVGARGDLETRLSASQIAMSLAPEWPMATIYTGDTLCRMKRAHEAWPYYRQGFAIGPNERSLIALALQCMHDEGILLTYEDELRALADEHVGSWLRFLAYDTLDNHEKNNGVDPQYRPRGYNEGPKEEKDEGEDEGEGEGESAPAEGAPAEGEEATGASADATTEPMVDPLVETVTPEDAQSAEGAPTD